MTANEKTTALTVEEYTEICLRFTEDTRNEAALDEGRFFVTFRGGWMSSCDNAHGGIGVRWAYGKSTEEIRRLAPEKYREWMELQKALSHEGKNLHATTPF